jgi:hypothetical protein
VTLFIPCCDHFCLVLLFLSILSCPSLSSFPSSVSSLFSAPHDQFFLSLSVFIVNPIGSTSHVATGEGFAATYSPVLSYRKKPKNAPGNRSDCVQLTEKRESSEVEGVVDSSKNIFKRIFGSQPTTKNMFKKDINFDDVSSNNEWIVADSLNPIEHDVVKDEGGHDMPPLEEIDD